MSEATERPWAHVGAGMVVAGLEQVAKFRREEDAELAVRAVNTHEEAIGLLREFVAEVSKAAYAPELEHLGPLVLTARALLSRLDGGTPRHTCAAMWDPEGECDPHCPAYEPDDAGGTER